MLSESEKELITSAIDGVITPEREEILRRLLLNCHEAALFYRDLIDQSRRLQAMPRIPAPAGLPESISARTRGTITPAPVDTTAIRAKSKRALSETAKTLITAAVDGELTSDQESTLSRLLSESAEAATLHRELLEQRRRLEALPRATAPAGTAVSIMTKVARKAEVRSTRRTLTRILPYAVAASVVLTGASLTFWLGSRFPKRDNTEVSLLPVDIDVPAPQPTVVREPEHPKVEAKPIVKQEVPLPPRHELVAMSAPERAPFPHKPGFGEIVGFGPLSDLQILSTYHAKIPVLIPIAEADKDESKEKVLRELSHDSLTRIDLFSVDTHRAAEMFAASAKKVGLDVHQDASVKEWMKKPAAKLDWAIYTESLTADEAAKLLADLAARTRNEKKLPTPFTMAHLLAARAPDHQGTKSLLGIDTSGTKLEVKSKTPAAQPKKDKTGIEVVYGPAVLRVRPEFSKEIQEFVDHRKHEERKPNSVPLLIVIRSTPQ